MHIGIFMSDHKLKALHEESSAIEDVNMGVERVQRHVQALIKAEPLLEAIPEKQRRLNALRSEYNSYIHDISKLNELESEMRVSARLSELLDKTYDKQQSQHDYNSVLLREGAVNGIVAFRNKMDAITEMVRDYKKAGFSVGVNGLSYSLDDWFKSIKKNPADAIFFARILSTHDACVRQFFEPQMVVNYIIKALPQFDTLKLTCDELSKMRKGQDFEEWRLERAKTILKAYNLIDEKGNFNKNGLNLTCREDLIGLIPEHSVMTLIDNALGEGQRYGFYFLSPLGLSKTLGIQGQESILDNYPIKLSNVNRELFTAFAQLETHQTLGM